MHEGNGHFTSVIPGVDGDVCARTWRSEERSTVDVTGTSMTVVWEMDPSPSVVGDGATTTVAAQNGQFVGELTSGEYVLPAPTT